MTTEERYELEADKISSIEQTLITDIMTYLRKFDKPEEGFDFVGDALDNISHFLLMDYEKIIIELKEAKCETMKIS